MSNLYVIFILVAVADVDAADSNVSDAVGGDNALLRLLLLLVFLLLLLLDDNRVCVFGLNLDRECIILCIISLFVQAD